MVDPQSRVFVARNIPQAGLDHLHGAGFDVDVWEDPLPPPRADLLSRVAGCAGVLTLLTDRADAEFFDAAGAQLKVVSNFAVGVNNIHLSEAAARGIKVGNTPDVLTEATADLAVALLLCAARRLPESAADVKSDRWKTWEPLGWIGQDIAGKTLGIFGLGRIGLSMAEKLRGGWGVDVIYCNRSANPEAESRLDARRVEFEALLAESDFLSVHAPLTDSTREIFSASAFRQMKNTAVFVNTARGELCDTAALIAALNAGEIFAAGLDVTAPEPLPADHPLLSVPNCLVVPHIGSATERSRNGMAEIAAANLIAGVRGEPLQCEVTAS